MLYEVITDSIPNKGSIPVQIKFNTSKLCKIAVKLVNKETNITKTQKNYYAHNTGKAIVHVITSYSIHYTKLYDFLFVQGVLQ